MIIWGHPKIMNLKFLKRVYIKFRRSSNACSLNWYSTHHWRIIHRLNESSITSWCIEDIYIEIKKNNFVLMNNLVNIAEFSKKQTHQKHITWKATLYNSWIKTITGLWTHYSVRTKPDIKWTLLSYYTLHSLTDFPKKYFISEKARALPLKLRILLLMKGNIIKMTMDRIDQKEQNDAKKSP